ncbi:unnamed protein product [Adineta steineri]|uniref:Prolyl 4-hydroxylase alpha subunit Fe(2+) 2OG dioxygenase domain-containing protein n=1 Tax=Adineta steineri TaxID=433720 RepID=A0A814KEV6_9BILA|nr:unnamed protein product [Adineta steineri]CAF1082194.1 unnamed protein product [Adineta steineri]
MDIKNQIQTVLGEVRSSGDYCGGGKLDIVPPNIVINNIGPLNFPLDEQQAKNIINNCQLAPFGLRDKTLYDTRVRHTWQLEPHALQSDVSLWPSQTIVDLKVKVINDLGLLTTEDEIEIELYKVLLYERGSFFKTHRDTEKKDGMFATLLIILPSFYTGGELVVRHQKREKKFNFCGDSENIHYAVLYADCEHELLPVIDGYRLVLAYNVVLLPKSSNQQVVESRCNTVFNNRLREIFASWLEMVTNNNNNNDKVSRKLIIPLDHEYTQASMKNGPLLKGKDVMTGEIIRYACESHSDQLLLFCVMLERNEDTNIIIKYYEPFGDLSKVFMDYCKILGLENQERTPISSIDLLDENIWNKLKLKSSEGSWTGNEAEYSCYWYNLSALLLLPHTNRHDLIFCPSLENGKFVYNMSNALWTVLRKLKSCKPVEDNTNITSAALDLITDGIKKSGIEITHHFRIPLLQCLVAISVLNQMNEKVINTVKNLAEQTLLVKAFFSVFSDSQHIMYERMAEVLFDAGNFFGWTVIADQIVIYNNKSAIPCFFIGISYNQPKLCANATWNQTAITFVPSPTVGTYPLGMFVDRNNSVYVADQTNGRIQVWRNGSTILTGNYSGGLSWPYSVFVTDNGDVYVDNGYTYYRVDKWGWNSTSSVPAMYVCGQCYGLFVDINNMLYCVMGPYHQVVSKSLDSRLNVWNIVAGTGTAGSTSVTLNTPWGMFVDINLNLYVADTLNNRIQKFASGQSNGTTIATGTIVLSAPTSVIFDADGYMFISDCWNHRLVGSGPNGFRCIAACSGYGSSSSQLYYPHTMYFDSYGNIFVTDEYNNRIQKFLLLPNSCNGTTTVTTVATVTSMNNTQSVSLTTTVSGISSATAPYLNPISYNIPKFTAYTTWSSNGITLADSTLVGTYPYSIFVDNNNTVYVSEYSLNRVQVWREGSSKPTRNISGNLNTPCSIFVTSNGDIYVDNGYANSRVDKWALNTTNSTVVMNVKSTCYGLFIDINNNIYCTPLNYHQVNMK